MLCSYVVVGVVVVVVVMMSPTQSYIFNDAVLVSFDVINDWLAHYC
jgi:hypothetical protein